jgi:hypothetical protein
MIKKVDEGAPIERAAGRRARSEGFLTLGEAEWIRDVLAERLAFERTAS